MRWPQSLYHSFPFSDGASSAVSLSGFRTTAISQRQGWQPELAPRFKMAWAQPGLQGLQFSSRGEHDGLSEQSSDVHWGCSSVHSLPSGHSRPSHNQAADTKILLSSAVWALAKVTIAAAVAASNRKQSGVVMVGCGTLGLLKACAVPWTTLLHESRLTGLGLPYIALGRPFGKKLSKQVAASFRAL